MLACLISLSVISACAEEEENLAVTNGCHSFDGRQAVLGNKQLIDNAGAVFMYETISDTVMYQWNGDQQFHPASLVKLMTGLLVLEKGTLSDTVTVTQNALDAVSYDAISVELQAGEKISVDHLMYCMLVYSANDAAAVLAEYIAGSQQEFVALMNARAVELGCTGTSFKNAHGLHDDDQYITARDLCRILSAALEYEEFRTYLGTINYRVPATNLHKERNLSSNNYLMNKESVAIYIDNRVTGGRTGVTKEGYRNIASLSQSGNMEIICIVMDAASTLSETGRTEVYGGFPETISLLDRAYSGFTRHQIIYPNQTLRQSPVSNGDNDVFVTCQEGFSTILPSDVSLEHLTFTYENISGDIQAPIIKGQKIASLQVWYDSLCVAQTEVYAMNNVDVMHTKAGTLLPDEDGVSWLAVVLIILAVAVVGVFIVVFILKYRSKKVISTRMRTHSGGVR